MIKEIYAPNLGEHTEVDVIEIAVNIGDKIDQDQTILTLETDKAAMDIPADVSGEIQSIHVKVGDKVSEGSLLLSMKTEQQESATDTQKIVIPNLGSNDPAEVIDVAVAVGDKIEVDDTILTLESDKASMDIPATMAGTVAAIEVKVGDKLIPGDHIIDLHTSATTISNNEVAPKQATPKKPAQNQPITKQESNVESSNISPHASPAVRRFARELGVDVNLVKGTGLKSRILKQDVQNYVKQNLNKSPVINSIAEIDFSQFGSIKREQLSRIKKKSGEFLHKSWVSIPHVTHFDEADITEMEEFRKQHKELAMSKDIRLTPIAFIIKAVVAALQEFPLFNSSLASNTTDIIVKEYYHVGIAVDTKQGLVVPVIQNVNDKGLLQIAEELGHVSEKARNNQLKAKDMSGGCFTISSLGGIGGTGFTPIINAPEVAILGVSKAKTTPVYYNGELKPRLMLPVALSYDHRVIDGADAARFTKFLCDQLADIRRLLLY